MRKVIYFLGISLFCFHAMATTDPNIIVPLNFDEHYHIDNKKIENNYLVVVPEEWKFPSNSNTARAQREKFELAISLLEQIMNSDKFKQQVLAYKRGDNKRLYQKNYLWKNSQKKLSNEDVFNTIMRGNEKMRPSTFSEMNINSYVKMCSRIERRVSKWCKGVVGSTNPNSSKWLKLNWKYYRGFKVHDMVGNIVHEWVHLLGFLHGTSNIKEEVPYVVGKIAANIAKDLLTSKK